MSRISRLFKYRKNKWIKEFFPEYADVFGGKYPKPIPVRYGRVRRKTGAPEMTPWEGWTSGVGAISPSGVRYKERIESTPQHYARYDWEHVGEDEYRIYCDSINFFRNGRKTPFGGPGLNPIAFVGAEDIRNTSEFWDRQTRNGPDVNGVISARNYITCKKGIYFPGGAPTLASPFGSNACFVRTEGTGLRADPLRGWEKIPKEYVVPPVYVSDKWGPANMAPPRDVWGDPRYPFADPTEPQEDYDERHWSRWLEALS